MDQPRISVVGLGKLGSSLAACLAVKGYTVIGNDINESYVQRIMQGQAPLYEPGLQDMITRGQSRLRATSSYRELIAETDITFLITPTPSEEDGSFSDVYLKAALRDLGMAFRAHRKRYHLFVITSTVSPGTTANRLIPWIEEHSGKRLGYNFGIAYNPEFIALGDVINGMLKPDLVLIGESDPYVGEQLAAIYAKLCENTPQIHRMSLLSAEITKLSLNAYITTKISFANTLQRICDVLPDAAIEEVTAALGSDRRISPYYLKAGPPYGGPCFTRDNRAFITFANSCGVEAPIARATERANKHHVEFIGSKVLSYVKKGHTALSILGLAFKHDTPVIDDSPAISLIALLRERFPELTLFVYDPLAMDHVKKIFGESIRYTSSARECVESSNMCVITTRHAEFQPYAEIGKTDGTRLYLNLWT